MKNFLFNPSILLLGLIVYVNCSIPDYIHVCHHNDSNLSECIINSIEALRSRLRHGIVNLGVPPLEPFFLESISINTSSGGSSLATNLTNVEVFGASNFKILQLIPTLTKNGYTFRFEVNIPKIDIQGKYKMDTKILFLQLRGNGPFTSNITNYHFSCLMKGKKVKNDGQNFLYFQQMKCTLEIETARIFLGNLFSGNEVLANATNAAINDNSDIFFEEIKPNILNAVSKAFTDIANKITLSFKYEDLFP